MHLHKMLKSSLLLLSGTALYAAPVITLNTTIPSEQTQIPHSICATKDGGFAIGGTTIDSTGHKSGFLIKTNSNGVRTGVVPFTGLAQKEITSVCQTFDGGYSVCGYLSPGFRGGEDWGIIKLDSTGRRVWGREFGYSGNDRPLCMIQTADSGFLMVGYTTSGAFDTTLTMIKLNKDGVSQWDRIRATEWSILTSVKQTRDGGYILTGGIRGTNAYRGGKDAFLYKVDSLGKQQWYKAFGGSGDDIGYSVDTTPDGGYVVAGSTTSFGNGLEDAFVLKADSLGSWMWHKTFGGTGKDEALGVIWDNDGIITFTGNMHSFSPDSAAMVYQLTSKGDSLWASRFGGFFSNDGTSLQKSVNNSFAICYPYTNSGDTVIGIATAVRIAKVAAGSYHSLFLKTNGTLWSCGDNSNGRLGDGTVTNRPTPVQVMSNVKDMDAGGFHSLILKTDGTLGSCGYNYYGQLGDGTTTNRATPVQVMRNVKDMDAGIFHSLILKTDGTLWSCGRNSNGQLGDGTTTNRAIPVQVMSNVQDIAAGAYHSLILKTDGTLWSCGRNEEGQLGNGTTTDRATPLQVMSNVKDITAGVFHSMILKTDGTLWSCGANWNGQLGDGTTTNRTALVQVMSNVQGIAGYYHSMILKTDGTLWSCGANWNGQLGDGTITDRPTPVQVMSNVQDIAAGGFHSMILKTDGTLWSCGHNGQGQLGDGTTTDRTTPVQIHLGN